jgi:hypothetical protein
MVALLPAAACSTLGSYQVNADASICTLDPADFDVPATCECVYDCCTGQQEGCFVLLPSAPKGCLCPGPTYLQCTDRSFSTFTCTNTFDNLACFGCMSDGGDQPDASQMGAREGGPDAGSDHASSDATGG